MMPSLKTSLTNIGRLIAMRYMSQLLAVCASTATRMGTEVKILIQGVAGLAPPSSLADPW